MSYKKHQVVKIGRRYYVDSSELGGQLEVTLDIKHAQWFDPTKEHEIKKMEKLRLEYGGVPCNLIDELFGD